MSSQNMTSFLILDVLDDQQRVGFNQVGGGGSHFKQL